MTFREKHSTMHTTLLIADKIQKAIIEDGLFSCGIFLDFSKIFDTVDHSILIRKLSHYGIRGIANDWFTSYLLNRRQHVSIGSTASDDIVIAHGVLQGSVLGPFYFPSILMTSVIAANYLTFTFLQMILIYFIPIVV